MLRTTLFLFSFLLLAVSCKNENTTSREAEQVYQDFRGFVSNIEQDTSVNFEKSEADWESEASLLLQEYSKHESKVNQHRDQFSVEKREEVKDLEERFELSYEQRQKLYDEARRRYRLRQDMLGIAVTSDDLTAITPQNITATYQKFVNTLVRNKEVYTERDWHHIEGWWSALNDRKTELNERLQPADQEMIAKKQEEYRSLRGIAIN